VGDGGALLALVAATLTDAEVPHALIGASALAVHGISRSTLDIDLLVTDRRVLSLPFWRAVSTRAAVEVRSGDADDPLAGVVRVSASGERDVDVIVGRGRWTADVIARARPPVRGTGVPAVRADDLVLLKLFAGGSQDRWDIEQVLALPERDEIVAGVDERIGQLPVAARQLWQHLKGA
jgi:hypothetical protein